MGKKSKNKNKKKASTVAAAAKPPPPPPPSSTPAAAAAATTTTTTTPSSSTAAATLHHHHAAETLSASLLPSLPSLPNTIRISDIRLQWMLICNIKQWLEESDDDDGPSDIVKEAYTFDHQYYPSTIWKHACMSNRSYAAVMATAAWGWSATLEYAVSNLPPPPPIPTPYNLREEIAMTAAYCGNHHILRVVMDPRKLLRIQDRLDTSVAPPTRSLWGDLRVVSRVLAAAAGGGGGKVSILKRFIINNAASWGDLVILKWARTNGCPWDERTCMFAALNGHLNVLKWARKNEDDQCPWDERIYFAAASRGYLDILSWALKNQCPNWNQSIKQCRELSLLHKYTNITKWIDDLLIATDLCNTEPELVEAILNRRNNR